MLDLEIDSLTGGSVYVPCVDRLGDGKTAFEYQLSDLIGGADGQVLPAYVPGEAMLPKYRKALTVS